MADVGGPFIGAEALSRGLVRKHELRARFRAIYPGIYLSAAIQPTFADRVEATWLWSRRRGVIAGLTAARMYGAKWIDEDLPIELVWPNARPPNGIRTSDMHLEPGETLLLGRVSTTSLERTAFDLARCGPVGVAVARIDALSRAAPLHCPKVLDLAERHRGTRGVRQVRSVLDLHDRGAESPKETWLRMLVISAGYPRPATQIPVRTGGKTYFLDLGWEDLKVGIEYDGDHHRTDRSQFAKDIVRLEELAELGWIVIRVAAKTPAADIIRRLAKSWAIRTSSTLR